MENIIQILPNTFIIRTQAGFNKLLKHLGCHTPDKDYTTSRPYHYTCYQYTNDENAFFLSEEYEDYDENGNLVYDENGKVKTHRYKQHHQYPIKYPCILSYQDETFECCNYYFFIRYIKDDLTIKELTTAPGINESDSIETNFTD